MKACRALDLSTITLLLTSVFQSVWSLSSRVSSAVCTSNATASHDLRNYVLHRRATLAGENKSFSTDQCAFQEETHFRGSYDFRRESIPRVHAYDTSLLLSYMKNRKPVVITGANVLGPAQTVWDFEYLKDNIKSPNLTVHISETRRFLYFEEQRNTGAYSWDPPHRKRFMSFSEFGEIVKQLELSPMNNTKVYLQTALKLADLSDEMQDYLFQFNYLWLNSLAHKLQWGDIDTNLLLVGMPEVVTPAHYDGMENLFTQVLGQKRCILFNPLQYRNLYPHPVHHPHDRQTQINFDAPDYNKFPRFRNAVGYEAIVRPGDLLYIPLNWWHYIESNSDSMTISINFWFSADLDTSEDNNTITPQTEDSETSEEELLQLMREIENSVGEKLKNKKQVKEFLLDIIDGRFDFLQ